MAALCPRIRGDSEFVRPFLRPNSLRGGMVYVAADVWVTGDVQGGQASTFFPSFFSRDAVIAADPDAAVADTRNAC